VQTPQTFEILFDATSVKRGLDGLGSSVAGFAGSIAKMGVASLAAGLTASGVAIVAFAKGSSEAAASMETLEIQFGVLLKSTEAAKNMIGEFRKEAIKSPLSVEDYAKAGKTLLAFGMSSEKVMPTLKALGDVSMGNSERFDSLALAFAQTQSAGRLMGQEVLQFVNAGFNPLQQISKKTGQSMVELKKAMEDGAISANMVAEAFMDATKEGGLFYGALEKGSQTTEGKIAKLKDTIFGLKVAFGTGFNEGLKDALDASNNFLPQFEKNMKIAGSYVGIAISEAVAGDASKFILLGEIIGEGIKVGLMTALSKGGSDIFKFLSGALTDVAKLNPLIAATDKLTGSGSKIQNKLFEADTSTSSIASEEFAMSRLPALLNQLGGQAAKIEAENARKEEISKQAELVKQIKSQMFEEFAPGSGIKQTVSLTKALGILMSIDKKLTTSPPAKM